MLISFKVFVLYKNYYNNNEASLFIMVYRANANGFMWKVEAIFYFI